MTRLDLFFAEVGTGAYRARCDAYPDFKYTVGALTESTRWAAEKALRAHAADQFEVKTFVVPLTNTREA